MDAAFKAVIHMGTNHKVWTRVQHMKSTTFVTKGVGYIADTGYCPSYFDWMAALCSCMGIETYRLLRELYSTELRVNEVMPLLFASVIITLFQLSMVFGGVFILPLMLRIFVYTENTCSKMRWDKLKREVAIIDKL